MAEAAPSTWRLGHGRSLALGAPRVMAIVNVTPDSFSDGGAYDTAECAVEAAARALADGADMLDVGGESTRPGAARVPAAEQARRVVPVIEGVRRAGGALGAIPISVDTTSAAVARAALDAGADAVNDVSAALEDAGMLELVAARGAGVVLMHRLAPPDRDSFSDAYAEPPRYGDVVAEVAAFLHERVAAALAAGVGRDAIVLDPGLGFGKSVAQNLDLVRRGGEIAALGYPVLSGASRKSFVGRVSAGADSRPRDRVGASIAFSVAHYFAGASLFRVHDVREQCRALRAAAAIRNQPGPGVI